MWIPVMIVCLGLNWGLFLYYVILAAKTNK